MRSAARGRVFQRAVPEPLDEPLEPLDVPPGLVVLVAPDVPLEVLELGEP
ncbi:hypothetical protein MNJPNG_25995 [Cupriavidus oxalaticus]